MNRKTASIMDPIFSVKRTVTLGNGTNYLIAPPGFSYSAISINLRRNIKDMLHALYISRNDEEWHTFITGCRNTLAKKKRIYLNWMFMPNRYNQLRVNTKIMRDPKASQAVIWADLGHWTRIGEQNVKDTVPITRNDVREILMFYWRLLTAMWYCHKPLEEVNDSTSTHKTRKAKQWLKKNAPALDFVHNMLGDIEDFVEEFKNNLYIREQIQNMRDTLGAESFHPLHRGTTKYV